MFICMIYFLLFLSFSHQEINLNDCRLPTSFPHNCTCSQTNSNIYLNKATSNRIHPSKFRIVLEPWNACKNNGKNLFFFAFIYSSVNHFEFRNTIRHSWYQRSTSFPTVNIAFVTGLSRNKTLNEIVKAENTKHGDIIQGDFLDDYRNLLYKLFAGWRWITKNCSEARYILKIDEDVYPNLDNLGSFLTRFEKFKKNVVYNSIMGIVFEDYPVIRIRDSKYYVSCDEYGHMTYKKLCIGQAYIVSTYLVPKLYNLSYYMRDFWLEDVYNSILGIELKADFINIKEFYVTMEIFQKEKLDLGSYLFVNELTNHTYLNILFNTNISNNTKVSEKKLASKLINTS